jgi:hypothetical protein
VGLHSPHKTEANTELKKQFGNYRKNDYLCTVKQKQIPRQGLSPGMQKWGYNEYPRQLARAIKLYKAEGAGAALTEFPEFQYELSLEFPKDFKPPANEDTI